MRGFYCAHASSASLISSSTFGSSIVAGVAHSSWSAIFFIVPRRILPERVLGSRLYWDTCILSHFRSTRPEPEGARRADDAPVYVKSALSAGASGCVSKSTRSTRPC